MAGFKFGSFDYFCQQSTLTLCPLVGAAVEPSCYARNLDINGTFLFQPATLFVYLTSIAMTIVMIYHIKQKYTAVGRREILIFFYLYIITETVELVVESGLIPKNSVTNVHFTAAHVAMTTATYWCLLINGFVGFQWAEDGTALSLWTIRGSCLFIFALTYFVSFGTFTSQFSFSSSNPVALFAIYILLNAASLVVYVFLQIVLVLNNLEDRWPLGHVLFGFTFYIAGIVFQFVVSTKVCEAAKHYVDGMFFSAVMTLLAVMLVYKYWDSITKEDLEFSVGGKSNVWEIKDPLLNDEQMVLLANEHSRMQQYMQDRE
ncbi:Chitin synthase, class 7 [Gonapodya sp. JEL0774]|nr:Chitin synthase, class 7 [Gonapodya sp. JEL0774]